MKKGSVFILGLVLSIFLFSVLPMVSAGHCEEINSLNINGMQFRRDMCNGNNVRYECGSFQVSTELTSILKHSCAQIILPNAKLKCSDGSLLISGTCKKGDIVGCSDDNLLVNDGKCENVQDGMFLPKCTNKVKSCPEGEVCRTFSRPVDENTFQIEYYCGKPLEERENSILVNTNPFLLKISLSIFLVVLALVVYTYLKPKKKRDKKK